MSLKEKLQEDLKSSMKTRIVCCYGAAIKQHEVDNRVELADDAIIDIISNSLSKERIHLLNSSRLTGMIWLKKQNLKYKF